MSRGVVVEVRAPDGAVLRLSGRVAEALLAVALELAARQDRLNRTEAWSLDLNCGQKKAIANVREIGTPVEFRSGLGA